jgi:hypothetical protein
MSVSCMMDQSRNVIVDILLGSIQFNWSHNCCECPLWVVDLPVRLDWVAMAFWNPLMQNYMMSVVRP